MTVRPAAVIATVFDPPTLGRLCEQLEASDCTVFIVRGRRTNEAWNDGIFKAREAGCTHALIVNDDIIVRPDDWPAQMLAHHAEGFTHVTAAVASFLPEAEPFPPGTSAMSFAPANKGHLFSVDLSVPVPPIPADLRMYYGDDWLYWQHRYKGRCCSAIDVALVTGKDAGLNDAPSGYSTTHPDFEALAGESMLSIARREHVIARRYFRFVSIHKPHHDGGTGWLGTPVGILPEWIA